MQILKKNRRMVIGITIAVVLAVLLSTVSCYVLAETLINSKDVVYQDNSKLMADNVQDAIDGTCSKIDTRLSDIEDKLYTVKNLYVSGSFVATTSLTYTGLSVTLPANSYCSVTAGGYFNGSPATMIVLSSSSTTSTTSLAVMDGVYGADAAYSSVTFSTYTTRETPVYLWAKYGSNARNDVIINGFCATKYK